MEWKGVMSKVTEVFRKSKEKKENFFTRKIPSTKEEKCLGNS